jgi:flavin-dependent dehydrogenase
LHVDVDGDFLTLERATLDALLTDAAAQSGACFAHGDVQALDTDAAGLVEARVRGLDRPLSATVAVLATGANPKLGASYGMVHDERPSAVAVRQYVRSAEGPKRLLVCYDRSVLPGYGWIFPMGDSTYNVGCGAFVRNNDTAPSGAQLRAAFARFCERFEVARALCQAGRPVSLLRGGALRCGLAGADCIGRGNVLAVGEVIGAAYPITGEGIGKAMETGALAAEVIDVALSTHDLSRLSDFAHRIAVELRPRYRAYSLAQHWLGWPVLVDFIAERSQKSRFLRDTFAGVLTEQVDPSLALSLGGLVRSFIS